VHTAGDGSEPSTNVRRLQPLRVLLAGRDRKFVRVTSFLLSRRGYEVAQTGLADVMGAVERHRADVLVLEPGESRGQTAQLISELQTAESSPAMVILVSGDGARWNGLSVSDKWTPIEDLVQKIEAAALHRTPPTVAAPVVERESTSL
jgi:CheY-like chemotaxis protein